MAFDFSSAFDSFSETAKGATKGITDFLQPDAARRKIAGLLPGGVRSAAKANAVPAFSSDNADWRVKVSLAKGATYFYKNADENEHGILAPLAATGGVIFPYTPQVSVTHAARYGASQLTHSNYTNYSYEGSEVQTISINGDFTAQNREEAAYVLACIHFFRSATKMWWGQDGLAGTPPPMVFLTGYGKNYFPNVPCVITSFQHTMPQDVDYISAGNVKTVVSQSPNYYEKARKDNVTLGSDTRIPTTSQISIQLQPIYSRKNIYNNFSLDKFAKGELLGGKDTGGGFI